MKRTPESLVMKSVTDFLDAKRVFWLRLNAGDHLREYKGKKYRVRGHAKGTADLLAFLIRPIAMPDPGQPNGIRMVRTPAPVWIECKAPGGRQSAAQVEFQAEVEAREHDYLLIDDVQKLMDWMKERGL